MAKIFGIPIGFEARDKGVGTYFNEGHVLYLGSDGHLWRRSTSDCRLSHDDVSDDIVDMAASVELDTLDPNTQQLSQRVPGKPHPDLTRRTRYRRS